MKPTLYIIHGWTYSIDPWRETVAKLRANQIDVVQLRVPGLTSPSDDVWTIDAYETWLQHELKDAKDPIVLGHSNGGRIALHYAANHPGALRHLILLNSAGVETAPGRLSLKRRVVGSIAHALRIFGRVPLLKKVVYRLLKSDYGNAPENMKKTLRNMLSSDKTFDPSPITTPTSIIWGGSDAVTPPAIGKLLYQTIKGSSFKLFPKWRHAPYITHPDELTNEISNIVKEVS